MFFSALMDKAQALHRIIASVCITLQGPLKINELADCRKCRWLFNQHASIIILQVFNVRQQLRYCCINMIGTIMSFEVNTVRSCWLFITCYCHI